MSELNKKPSHEALQDLVVLGVTFATSVEVADSIKESNKKTEVWTLSEQLKNLADMSPIPKLKSSNWRHWCESVSSLITLSQTSAVFLKEPPQNRAVKLWSIWWSSKLKDTAPHVHTAPSDTARGILKEIIVASQAQAHHSLLNTKIRFWNFKPSNNMTCHDYVIEFQKRFHDLREHTNITTDVKVQIRNLLLSHLNKRRPEIVSHCKNLSLEQTLSECLSKTTNDKVFSKPKNDLKFKCNFCQNLGHTIDECRKKKRAEKEQNKPKILSVNRPDDSLNFQLDTASDSHVSGNINDFSSHSKSSQIIGVAGGGQVNTEGYGDMYLPTSDGKLEILTGAIHLPGETSRILFTSQLENQGFSIHWPSNYQDIELLRPDGSTCTYFRREAGKLIWRPKPLDIVKSVNNNAKRDWHAILGHPGKKALCTALEYANITGYKPPEDCDTCTEIKITITKVYGTLKTACKFTEVIHMDLVGGQKSLSPVTIDSSIPNATWFLLAVDEFTSYKWAWPIYSKKTVHSKIQHFLQYLKTNHNKMPKIIHTDSGTEFSNTELQQILLNHGILWHKSSSHAPEQNSIAERMVRTVTEKMRALHLQSGIPVRLWPLILNAAINVLNVTLNSIASKSPFYTVFKKLPDIKKLLPFGCRAYWLDPNRNKLNSKAKEGIYVGTEFSGGHIILNPKTDKTIVRRDIRAYEFTFPLKTKILSIHASNRTVIQNALSGPFGKNWGKDMDDEMENMARNKVWTLVPRSEANGKLMTGKWIPKEKPDGKLKARWCARGFAEPYAENTYADVLQPTTLRMLLAFAALQNLQIRHVDITAAFLHAELDIPIYIEQPHNREKPGNLVCKLQKAIYGLKTAPRRWQEKLRQVLHKNNYKQFKNDQNVFRNNDTIISTYVDDFMIFSSSHSKINQVIKKVLANAFQIKDLGNLTKFLGINISRKPDGIRINQEDKIQVLCEDMGMFHCKGAFTPIADDNIIDRDPSQLCSDEDSIMYRSAVGTLLHIANTTRPDIQYAVNRLSCFGRSPSQNCMLALKHPIRYVSRTKSASLFFRSKGASNLTASSDSSWGNTTSSKGTSGTLFLVNNSPIAWWSNKQTITAQSTCEAEYTALAKLAVIAQWLRPLYLELFLENSSPIITEIDNTAALITANSTKIPARNRHFLMRRNSS